MIIIIKCNTSAKTNETIIIDYILDIYKDALLRQACSEY